MKKLLLIVVGVALASTFAFGQTQVLSRNAVGYTKVTAPRGGFSLLQNDFYALAGSSTPSNLFGLYTFPTGTQIYVWDNIGSKYNIEALSSNKLTGLAWTPNTNALEPGQGFWVGVPSVALSNDYTAFLMGEVPDRITAPTTDVNIVEGYNLLGFPYPVDTLWTNTELAKNAVTGDVLYAWGGSGYSLNVLSSNKLSGLAWTFPTQVVYVGRGYWFSRTVGAGGFTWSEPKPYTWP